MASLPVMGLLANNHLGERGLFAYVDLKCGVATIYVPFVTSTEHVSQGSAMPFWNTEFRGQIGDNVARAVAPLLQCSRNVNRSNSFYTEELAA